MGTEFRKGPPTIAQVEAAARLNLLWRGEGYYPWKLAVRDGVVVGDCGRPFHDVKHMRPLDQICDPAAIEWRPIRLSENQFETVPVDWSELEPPATTTSKPTRPVEVGDTVFLRAWTGSANGNEFGLDLDRPKMVGQRAKVKVVCRDGDVVVECPGLLSARWSPGYFDLVEKPAPNAQPAPAPVAPKVGDSVRLHKFEDGPRIVFNPKMQPLVGTVQKIQGFNDLGIKLEGYSWTWAHDAFELVALSAAAESPVAVPEVPFRALADISLEQIQAHQVKEKTTMSQIQHPTPTPDTFVTRLTEASKEGAKRALVEAGVDKGHEWLKELLISAGGDMSPREEGIVREYLTRLLSSPYGKALGAYAVGEGLTLAAPHLGARAPLAAAAGREFRNRATTVAAKSAAGDLFALLPRGVCLVNELLNGFGDSLTPETKEPAALSSGAISSTAFAGEAELTIPR